MASVPVHSAGSTRKRQREAAPDAAVTAAVADAAAPVDVFASLMSTVRDHSGGAGADTQRASGTGDKPDAEVKGAASNTKKAPKKRRQQSARKRLKARVYWDRVKKEQRQVCLEPVALCTGHR